MIPLIYDVHVLVCNNECINSDVLSCGDAHGLALVSEFKKQLKQVNVSLKMRANKSGCLGICTFGPTIAIYPEGIFYVGVQLNDVSEIVQSHIINKMPVERLLFKK